MERVRPSIFESDIPNKIITATTSFLPLLLFLTNLVAYFRQDEARDYQLLRFNITSSLYLLCSRYAGY